MVKTKKFNMNGGNKSTKKNNVAYEQFINILKEYSNAIDYPFMILGSELINSFCYKLFGYNIYFEIKDDYEKFYEELLKFSPSIFKNFCSIYYSFNCVHTRKSLEVDYIDCENLHIISKLRQMPIDEIRNKLGIQSWQSVYIDIWTIKKNIWKKWWRERKYKRNSVLK